MKTKIFINLNARILTGSILIFAMTTNLFSQDIFYHKENEKIFKQEADDFLKSMSKDLQTIQANAIKTALNGDYTDLIQVRNARNIPITLPDGVKARYITEKMRVYYPSDLKNGEKLPCLIYLHGGCWIFGSINSCSSFCSQVTKTARVIVIALDYSLAPTNPYPAALNDISECMDFIIEHADSLNVDTKRISVGGDSAGGNMAIVTAIRQRQMHKQPYASVIAFYPVTKAWDDNSKSWNDYKLNSGLEGELMDIGNIAYTGKSDSRNPEISPAMYKDEDLKLLPETLIIAADRDILKDQGKEFFDKIQSLGIKSEYHLLPYTYHLFITVKGQTEAFNQSVKLTGKILNKR